MRQDAPDGGEVTPEMVEHYMEKAHKMRAKHVQHIVKTILSNLTRLLENTAKTVKKAASSVLGSACKSDGMQSSGAE